jgi:hypothetical protein
MTSVWFFTETSRAVQVTAIKKVDCETIKKMIGCSMLDVKVFETDPHTRYMIWMNDVGLYEDHIPNLTASMVLGKLHMNWGRGMLTGKYVVSKEVLDPAWYDMDKVTDEMWQSHPNEGWNHANMNVTDIRQWIADINVVIKKSVEEQEKWMKEMAEQGNPVKVIELKV